MKVSTVLLATHSVFNQFSNNSSSRVDRPVKEAAAARAAISQIRHQHGIQQTAMSTVD